MKNLKDRIAVVTGAGSGIGQATSVALARKGCHLALADISSQGLEETARKVEALGRKASHHIVDVADKKRMEAFPAEIEKEHGAAHIIVNNAGIGIAATLEDHSMEDLEKIIGINLWGVVYGCKFFLPLLKKQDEGHIVNISSLAGLIPAPGMSSYCLTKFAVRGFTESIRPELKQYGIGVTSVHPGVINTNIPKATKFIGRDAEKTKNQGVKAFSRLGHPPEAVANKIVRAIERNQQRILIGPETYVFDYMKRVFPVGSDAILNNLTGRLSGN